MSPDPAPPVGEQGLSDGDAAALVAGEHSVAFLSQGPAAPAVQLDARFADLDLGLADPTVMAAAERDEIASLGGSAQAATLVAAVAAVMSPEADGMRRRRGLQSDAWPRLPRHR